MHWKFFGNYFRKFRRKQASADRSKIGSGILKRLLMDQDPMELSEKLPGKTWTFLSSVCCVQVGVHLRLRSYFVSVLCSRVSVLVCFHWFVCLAGYR